jgi:hypothetical protein
MALEKFSIPIPTQLRMKRTGIANQGATKRSQRLLLDGKNEITPGAGNLGPMRDWLACQRFRTISSHHPW